MDVIYYIYAILPSYRKDFFERLEKGLIHLNIDLKVLHGTHTDKKIVHQSKEKVRYKKEFTSKKLKLSPIKLIKINNLFKYIKRKKPDGVVISYMPTNVTMLRIVVYCLINKIPYATWRCGYNRPNYNRISRFFRTILINFVEKKATLNITYGTVYRDELINKGIKKENIIIAQNTINVDEIIEHFTVINKSYTSTLNVLFVGALIKGKLLKSSIDAIKRMCDEGYDVKFNIVGGGEIYGELIRYSESLGLKGKVNIVGAKYGDEVKKYFSSADIFLLAGTGGLALNEAMAYGLPIITTMADGTGFDLVINNGYILKNFGDSEEQYSCLKQFINLSDQEKREMALASQNIVKTKASLNNMVLKHTEACNKLLNNEI